MKSPFNGFVNRLSTLAQNKILLAILAAVTSLSGFEVWKWNQEQHQEFMTEQKAKCQDQLDSAWRFVSKSSTLYKRMSETEGEQTKPLEQPSINTKFEKDKLYILLYRKPHSLIPEAPIYDDLFFHGLAKVAENSPPPPLWVLGKSEENNKITVFSYCSPKPFEVSPEDLYESHQKSDFKIIPFGSF